MSYIIQLSNGNILTVVNDNSINSTFANLSLIGKGYEGYGTAFDDNMVHLAENFASPSAPVNPLVGQLWYNTTSNSIGVYTGTSFQTIGQSVIVSNSAPLTTADGLQWWNSYTEQLFSWGANSASWELIGPVGTYQSGVSGWVLGNVLVGNATPNFTQLYSTGNVIAIATANAITTSSIPNFVPGIRPGLNFPHGDGLQHGIYNLSELTVGTGDILRITTDTAISNGSSIFQTVGGNTLVLTNGLPYVNSVPVLHGTVYTPSLVINAGSNTSYAFPTSRGVIGQSLITDGYGYLAWSNPYVSAAGSQGELQYNNANNLGATSNITTDGANLSIAGGVLSIDTQGISGTGLTVANGAILVTGVGASITATNITASGQLNGNVVSVNYGSGNVFTLPSTRGANGQFMVSAGNGVTLWANLSISNTAAGANGAILFNQLGTPTSAPNITTDGTGFLSANLIQMLSTILQSDNGANIATTSWLKNNFGSNISPQDATFPTGHLCGTTATAGYIQLPTWLGGIIIQWGYQPVTNSTFYFPTPFPNNCLVFICSNTDAQGDAGDIAFGNALFNPSGVTYSGSLNMGSQSLPGQTIAATPPVTRFYLGTKPSSGGAASHFPCTWIAFGY